MHLANIAKIPDIVNCKNTTCDLDFHLHDIDQLHTEVIDCLDKACLRKKMSKKHIPGWNDHLKEWHNASRDSYFYSGLTLINQGVDLYTN